MFDSLVPGLSGIIAQTSAQTDREDYSYSDDEIPNNDKSAVCKTFSPDWRKKPFKSILNCGQCDKSARWVHLTFHSSTRLLRRGDNFQWPLCAAESN